MTNICIEIHIKDGSLHAVIVVLYTFEWASPDFAILPLQLFAFESI